MAIKIPNLGDGIDSAVVLSVAVKVGDTVEKDQTVIELETDKAVAPVPSTAAGTVSAILVNEGDDVKEGQVVVQLDGASASGSGGGEPAAASSEDSSSAPTAAPVAAPSAPFPVAQPQVGAPIAVPQAAGGALPTVRNENVAASPTIKKIARWIGLDLGLVHGTGSGGRIEMHDLQNYIQTLQALAYQNQQQGAGQAVAVEPAGPKPLGIDFSKWGPVKEEKVSNLRKKIGQNLQETWNAAPHVTQFDEVDVTHLMALRKKYKDKYAKKGASLTLTGICLSVIAKVLKEFPAFNSSYDEAESTLIYKEYVHLGVAVDTENGLIVPVLRDADKKSIFDLSVEVGALAEKARDRSLARDDMMGGTFTVSNLGGLGVGAFTPIINHPEVAILGLSRGKQRAVFVDGKFEPRILMPISVSYDHRVIDGADGARFIRSYIDALENFDEAELKLKGVK